MSDSGRVLGDCRHGFTREACPDCSSIENLKARIKELEAEKAKLLKGPNYNQGWELDAEVERLLAENAAKDAESARLRSLVSRLVQSLEENLEAHEAREDRPCVRVARKVIQEARDALDAAVKEARDGK